LNTWLAVSAGLHGRLVTLPGGGHILRLLAACCTFVATCIIAASIGGIAARRQPMLAQKQKITSAGSEGDGVSARLPQL
jgi:hypothetical protein